MVLILLIYAPLCHMTWHPDGLFFKMGVLDFAGGVVHMSAVGAWQLEQCFR
jgi:Amt family ammonium transporter